MSDLRAELAATKHLIYRLGNAWVVLRWSGGCQAFFTHNMKLATERQAIQIAIYGEFESDEYAAHFAS